MGERGGLAVAVILGAMASAAIGVPRASAEWMVDLYGGAAITKRSDARVVSASPTMPVVGTVPNVAHDTSSAAGARVGYWFESWPLIGLSVDAFRFQPDWSAQRAAPNTLGATDMKHSQLGVTSLALDLMLRWPVWATPALPRGRLQPYLTVGPAVAITSLWMDLADDVLPQMPEPSTSRRDVTTALGVQAGAGIVWQLQKHLGVFIEYRFTHFTPEYTLDEVSGWSSTTIKIDLDSHTVLGGLSVRF